MEQVIIFIVSTIFQDHKNDNFSQKGGNEEKIFTLGIDFVHM